MEKFNCETIQEKTIFFRGRYLISHMSFLPYQGTLYNHNSPNCPGRITTSDILQTFLQAPEASKASCTHSLNGEKKGCCHTYYKYKVPLGTSVHSSGIFPELSNYMSRRICCIMYAVELVCTCKMDSI